MVISPHTKKALLDRFGSRGRRSSLERLSAQAQAREVVRRGKVVRHCLGGSGETFDIEARLLAEALDFSWGQPDFLYFYALFQG